MNTKGCIVNFKLYNNSFNNTIYYNNYNSLQQILRYNYTFKIDIKLICYKFIVKNIFYYERYFYNLPTKLLLFNTYHDHYYYYDFQHEENSHY